MDAIFERRSIRKFKTDKIDNDTIRELIEAGRMAPSAKNRQPWKYLIFSGPKKEVLLNVMDQGLDQALTMVPEQAKPGVTDAKNTLRIMRGAPVIVIVLNTNGRSPFRSELDIFGRITEICDSLSIGASIENILLKATEKGIGTVWIANTFFAHEPLVSFLKTDDQLIGAIAMGYPDEVPVMRPRKSLDDILEFID